MKDELPAILKKKKKKKDKKKKDIDNTSVHIRYFIEQSFYLIFIFSFILIFIFFLL